MYVVVATKLSVPANSTAYSQAVSMAGANAVQVDVTCFAAPGSTITVTLQGSNDLENWGPSAITLSTTIAFTSTPGYLTASATGIAFAYVRLVYTNNNASGTAIIGAGINTANL